MKALRPSRTGLVCKKLFTPPHDYATSEENIKGAAMLKSTRPFPLAASAISVAGLLFCLWVLFTGGHALCLTDGCTLFQDFRLAGISLWQAGAVLFTALIVLSLFRLSRAAYCLSALALAADAVLLCIMLFTAPCVNCLIVGTLIALSFLAFRSAVPPVRKERSTLALVWLVLLIVDLGGVLRDLADPWSPRAQENQSSVQVYFSPSCRACQTLLANADKLQDACWYPVPENTRDIWVIAVMAEKMAQGMPVNRAAEEAGRAVPEQNAFDEDPGYRLGLLRPDMLMLQFRLWRNHAHVLAAGSDRLPFVEFKGLPSFLTEGPAPQARPEDDAARRNEPANDDTIISGLGVAGFCDGTDDSPCEESDNMLSRNGESGNLIDTSGMMP